MTPSFTADVLHDFFSPGQMNVGGTTLANRLGKTWYELGVGLTGSFRKRSTLYADIRHAHSMGGGYRRTAFSIAARTAPRLAAFHAANESIAGSISDKPSGAKQ